MKLKFLYLGLLSTLVMASQAEAMRQRVQDAPQMQEKLREHEHVAAQVQPHLDLAGHGHNPVAAVADINDRLGVVAAHPAHATANERLSDAFGVTGHITPVHSNQGILNGVGNLELEHLNPRLEAILARLKAGIAGTDLNAGEYRLRTLDVTRTAHTGAGGAPHANDLVRVAAAASIEDVLTELGW